MNHSTIDGSFRLEPQGRRWLLRDAGGAQVLLSGADIDAGNTHRSFARIHIQWRGGGADVELSGGGATLLLHAQEVLVHQPLPSLYTVLPLARYDERTRRFWQRVFWIVRIPGGGALLKVLARRARAKA